MAIKKLIWLVTNYVHVCESHDTRHRFEFDRKAHPSTGGEYRYNNREY